LNYLSVFKTKLFLNLRAEASKTYLGYLWWVLEPGLHVVVLYFVFGVFLQRGTEHFVVFLVCGLIPFLWLSRTVSNSASAILVNRGIINQTAIHKAFFPLLVVFQDFTKQIFVFLLMFAFLGMNGFLPGIEWLGLVPIITTELLLIIACSLIAAAIVPFIPDIRYIIATGLMLLMFGSGIFYSYEQVLLPQHRQWFLLNPMANLVKNYRQVIMHGEWPDWQALAIIALASTVVIFLMLRVYKRADTAFARLVAQ